MKSEKLTIRVSEREKEILEINAYREKKNLSEYCRCLLMDRELEKLNYERISDRLGFIKDLLEDNQNSKSNQAFNFENVIIDMLLLLRSRTQKSDKDMILAELKRNDLTPWTAKGFKKN